MEHIPPYHWVFGLQGPAGLYYHDIFHLVRVHAPLGQPLNVPPRHHLQTMATNEYWRNKALGGEVTEKNDLNKGKKRA